MDLDLLPSEVGVDRALAGKVEAAEDKVYKAADREEAAEDNMEEGNKVAAEVEVDRA